jgi:hypothetical protein
MNQTTEIVITISKSMSMDERPSAHPIIALPPRTMTLIYHPNVRTRTDRSTRSRNSNAEAQYQGGRIQMTTLVLKHATKNRQGAIELTAKEKKSPEARFLDDA